MKLINAFCITLAILAAAFNPTYGFDYGKGITSIVSALPENYILTDFKVENVGNVNVGVGIAVNTVTQEAIAIGAYSPAASNFAWTYANAAGNGGRKLLGANAFLSFASNNPNVVTFTGVNVYQSATASSNGFVVLGSPAIASNYAKVDVSTVNVVGN
ncbi:hypothetical protein WJX72_008956 [[Myrmecia] bisecta]|uniref:Uncharacterized protein n=1 Tax=[Myrmecia] bisecta TaxID=41462 RepID=A0AAW1QSL4_9CHLO